MKLPCVAERRLPAGRYAAFQAACRQDAGVAAGWKVFTTAHASGASGAGASVAVVGRCAADRERSQLSIARGLPRRRRSNSSSAIAIRTSVLAADSNASLSSASASASFLLFEERDVAELLEIKRRVNREHRSSRPMGSMVHTHPAQANRSGMQFRESSNDLPRSMESATKRDDLLGHLVTRSMRNVQRRA